MTSYGALPVNLLQSQLALNKNYLQMLHSVEAEFKAEASSDEDYKEIAKCKKQIVKYALLQKSLKAAISQAAADAAFWDHQEDTFGF